MFRELEHEVGSFFSTASIDNASLHITNALRVLQLIWLIDCLELILHLLLLSLLLFDLLTEVLANLLSEDVLHGLVEELGIWLALFLEELGDEGVRRIGIVNSLLSDLDLVANLTEQTATRLGRLVDSFAFNERAGLHEVVVLHHNEAASGTGLPFAIQFDLLGEGLKDCAQRISVVLICDDHVRIDH